MRPSLRLLDGAMGTELIARGLPPDAPPEAWVLSRPDEIRAVHAAHAAAGATTLLTCTFGANRERLARSGLSDRLEAICGWAVRLAREAAPGTVVAGSVGPTGLAGPGRALDVAAIERAVAPQVDALARAGADLLWVESQYDAAEATRTVALARRTGLPVACTLALADRGGALVLPDGGDPLELLEHLASLGAAVLGFNCVAPGPALEERVRAASARLPVPVAVRPHAGLPGALLPPGPWANAVAALAPAGAALLGGCCQATPAHVAALGARLAALSG